MIFFLLFFFSFFFWFTTLFSKIAQLFPIRFDAFIFLFFGFPEGRGVVVYSSLFSYSFSLFFSVPSLILLLQTMECVCFFFFSSFLFLCFVFQGGCLPLYMERSFQLFLERHQPVPTLESILSSFLCIIESREEGQKMGIGPKGKTTTRRRRKKVERI